MDELITITEDYAMPVATASQPQPDLVTKKELWCMTPAAKAYVLQQPGIRLNHRVECAQGPLAQRCSLVGDASKNAPGDSIPQRRQRPALEHACEARMLY